MFLDPNPPLLLLLGPSIKHSITCIRIFGRVVHLKWCDSKLRFRPSKYQPSRLSLYISIFSPFLCTFKSWENLHLNPFAHCPTLKCSHTIDLGSTPEQNIQKEYYLVSQGQVLQSYRPLRGLKEFSTATYSKLVRKIVDRDLSIQIREHLTLCKLLSPYNTFLHQINESSG